KPPKSKTSASDLSARWMTWLKISGAKAPYGERAHGVKARRDGRRPLTAAAHVAKEKRRSVALVHSSPTGERNEALRVCSDPLDPRPVDAAGTGRRLRGHHRQPARRRAPQSCIP